MSIPRGSTERPVAVWMLFLAIVLLGVISYVRLPIDLLPDANHAHLLHETRLTTDLTPIYGRGPDATPMDQRQ